MGHAVHDFSPLDRAVTSSASPPATQATFAIGDERTASRIVDAITESYPNPDMAIAAERVRQAEAQVKIAGASLFPELSFGAATSRREVRPDGGPVGSTREH